MCGSIKSAVRQYLTGVIRALAYPFEHRAWAITLLIGGALFFIPVVGAVVVAMYQDATLRNILRGSKDPLPTWWNVFRKRNMIRDVLMDLVSDVLKVVPLFLLLLAMRLAIRAVWMPLRREGISPVLDSIFTDFPLIDYPYYLFLVFLSPALLLHSATCTKFRSRFNYRSMAILVAKNFRGYLIAWLQTPLLMVIVISLFTLPIFIFARTSNVGLAIEYNSIFSRFVADWVTFYLVLGIVHLFGTALRSALGSTILPRDEDS